MLKEERWLSIVFQHWNVAYFEAILSAAADSGAELKAAVAQIGDPIWSMHKKKNQESVLAGELILTFHKTGVQRRLAASADLDLGGTIRRILASADANGVYGEDLFNQIVIEAWNKNAMGSLSVTKDEFARVIEDLGWRYDSIHHFWAKGNQAPASLFEGLA